MFSLDLVIIRILDTSKDITTSRIITEYRLLLQVVHVSVSSVITTELISQEIYLPNDDNS